jgi:hypothetical protein
MPQSVRWLLSISSLARLTISILIYYNSGVAYLFCLGISTRYSYARLYLFASTSPIQSNFAVLNTSFAPKTLLRMYAHYAEFRYPSERARERHEFNIPRQKTGRHEYVTGGDSKSRRMLVKTHLLSRSEGAFHISQTNYTSLTIQTTQLLSTPSK